MEDAQMPFTTMASPLSPAAGTSVRRASAHTSACQARRPGSRAAASPRHALTATKKFLPRHIGALGIDGGPFELSARGVA
jgi:hypothetical protein